MFIEYSTKIKEQSKAQRILKQELQERLAGNVYIHMDFVGDYRYGSQEEIQSIGHKRKLLCTWLCSTTRKTVSLPINLKLLCRMNFNMTQNFSLLC